MDPEEKKLRKALEETNLKFEDYKKRIRDYQKKMDNDSNFEKAVKIETE